MELAVPSAEKLPEGIENPFVITTLVAGLIGVTISIILLISIWILASAVKQRQKANKGLKPMNMIHGLTAHKNGNEASSLENPSYVPPPLRQDDKVIIKIPKESSGKEWKEKRKENFIFPSNYVILLTSLALSVNPTQDLLLKSVEEVDQ